MEHHMNIDELGVVRACVAVLDRAILLARFLASRRGKRISDEHAAQLHDLLDAVHNVPAVIEAPGSSFFIQSGCLRSGFEDYDARWSRAPFDRCSIERLSLLTVYEAALAAPLEVAPEAAADDATATWPGAADGGSPDRHCVLLPGLTAHSSPEIEAWALAATARASTTVTGRRRSARVRAFRWPDLPAIGSEILELFLTDELGNVHLMSFTAGDVHDFHLEEPAVPDLVEALHMAGIVIRMLGADVRVGAQDAFERNMGAAP
jgi:hypothetical protein